MVTKFETMSNELLMELFEYYDCYSLFLSFGSLNSRISNLIYHHQVSVDFDQIKPIDFVDFICHILPKFNAKNIRSLKSSNPYQIGILAYDRSLACFTHIRSLSLNNTQSNVIEYMVSHLDFSRLERASFEKYENQQLNTWTVFDHFLNSNRYQFLRMYKDCCTIPAEISSKLLIEHATFTDLSLPCKLFDFLSHSPCLKYIKTGLFFHESYPKLVFLSPIPYYHTLTRLNLQLLGQVCMDTIVYLFQCVPRVCDLQLTAQTSHQLEYVDPIFWENFFSKYLVELKRLSLIAYTSDHHSSINSLWNFLIDREKVMDVIEKSTYWSSHRWKTIFYSHAPIPSNNCYFAKFEVF